MHKAPRDNVAVHARAERRRGRRRPLLVHVVEHAVDRVLAGSSEGDLEAARAMVESAPFFSSGLPVLIAPYHLGME